MAAKTIKMEQLKLIRQLQQKGYSIKGIARNLGLSRNTVRKYVGRLKTNGEDVAAALQEDRTTQQTSRYRKLIEHFGQAEGEIRKTGVTRQLLWLEYKELNVDGYNYSQYCYHFREYLRHKEVVMHLEHKAGEEVMIDFAGQKLSYVETETGEVVSCQVFVSVLPFSGLVFIDELNKYASKEVPNISFIIEMFPVDADRKLFESQFSLFVDAACGIESVCCLSDGSFGRLSW